MAQQPPGFIPDPPETTALPPGFIPDEPTEAPDERTWGDTAADVAIGAAKGLGNTAFGLGKIVHDYTPVGRISDAIQPGAFDQRPPELTPTNTPQQVGFTGEQVAEYFIPAGTATKAAKAVNVAKDAALAYAQSGSPVQAGVSGAITAVVPGARAATKIAGALERSAQETMADALRATKEWAKAESEKLAPEMLKRGVKGSLPQIKEQAKRMAARAGQNLADAYRTAAAAGETVPGAVIQGNIRTARDTLHVAGPSGTLLPIPGYEQAIGQLDNLETFIGQLGADIPVDKAAAVKQAWDEIVSKAGLYGPKAMASASDSAKAWSFKQAAHRMRTLLNTNPTIAELNKEAGFWIGLRDVTQATKLRKIGQTGGLTQAVAASAGAIAGGASGEGTMDRIWKGAAGALAARQLTALLTSTRVMTSISAPMKQALADALASGQTGQIASVVGRIFASVPAQLRPVLAQ